MMDASRGNEVGAENHSTDEWSRFIPPPSSSQCCSPTQIVAASYMASKGRPGRRKKVGREGQARFTDWGTELTSFCLSSRFWFDSVLNSFPFCGSLQLCIRTLALQFNFSAFLLVGQFFIPSYPFPISFVLYHSLLSQWFVGYSSFLRSHFILCPYCLFFVLHSFLFFFSDSLASEPRSQRTTTSLCIYLNWSLRISCVVFVCITRTLPSWTTAAIIGRNWLVSCLPRFPSRLSFPFVSFASHSFALRSLFQAEQDQQSRTGGELSWPSAVPFPFPSLPFVCCFGLFPWILMMIDCLSLCRFLSFLPSFLFNLPSPRLCLLIFVSVCLDCCHDHDRLFVFVSFLVLLCSGYFGGPQVTERRSARLKHFVCCVLPCLYSLPEDNYTLCFLRSFLIFPLRFLFPCVFACSSFFASTTTTDLHLLQYFCFRFRFPFYHFSCFSSKQGDRVAWTTISSFSIPFLAPLSRSCLFSSLSFIPPFFSVNSHSFFLGWES